MASYPPVPIYENYQLEDLAKSFLADKYPSLQLPVDIDLLIVKEGFDIHPIPNMWSDCGVRALPVCYQGIPAICIDQEHLDRYAEISRFTLAEELGHLLLHKSAFQDCDSLEKSIERYLELPGELIDKMDKNARYLGAAILMPEIHVAKDFEDFIGRQNLSAFASVTEALEWMAGVLCKKYRVTEIALKHRLMAKAFYELRGRLLDRIGRFR